VPQKKKKKRPQLKKIIITAVFQIIDQKNTEEKGKKGRRHQDKRIPKIK
jgi:hypothetical protein